MDKGKAKAVIAILEQACWPAKRPILDAVYGPAGRKWRVAALAELFGCKVNPSDKSVQWGNFRGAMFALVGAEGDCMATREQDFERKARAILEAD